LNTFGYHRKKRGEKLDVKHTLKHIVRDLRENLHKMKKKKRESHWRLAWDDV
jgi:hypothetical protein